MSDKPSKEAMEAAQKAMADLVDCCHCPTPCIIHENDVPIIARALDAFAAERVKAALEQERAAVKRKQEYDDKCCRSCGGYNMGSHFCAGRSDPGSVNERALRGAE